MFVSFILKFLCPEFIKKVLDFCIKKNPFKTFAFGIIIIGFCYYIFEKPKDFSPFSEKERYEIRKEMLKILSNCQADGSGISYAAISSKNSAELHDIRSIDVFGYSLLFPDVSHIQQLGNIDMFLIPDPMDDVAYAQIIQKFLNEFSVSKLIEINTTSEIVNTSYIKAVKAKLWVRMNVIRINKGLKPYKLTQMQIYPILDKKSQMIYLLAMTFTNDNECNDISFQSTFDELGIKIKNAVEN
jgi:hypothetical protein